MEAKETEKRVGFMIIFNGLHHLQHNNYINHIAEMFDKFVFVEGASGNKGSTRWCKIIPDKYHKNGKSIDGTREFLETFCTIHNNAFLANNFISHEGFWESKDAMCNAAIKTLKSKVNDYSFLWEIDADEQWTKEKLKLAEEELVQKEADCGFFWCDYFVGKNIVAQGIWGEGKNSEYKRLWKWKGQEFLTHESPTLIGGNGKTVWLSPRFIHYAYYFPQDVQFKEDFYAINEEQTGSVHYSVWQTLQSCKEWPQPLTKLLSGLWGKSDTILNNVQDANFWGERVDVFPKQRIEIGRVYPSITTIHQTWKTKQIPTNIFNQKWVDSWKQCNPNWDYKLWDDQDNRSFIQTYYPEFLEIYNGYNLDIKRADAIRYFILHKYGGLYADLDCICLKPLLPIIKNRDLVLGVEPQCKWKNFNKNNLMFSNAIMYSQPGHQFWNYVIEELKSRKHRGHPLDETGPLFLTRVCEKYLQTSGRIFLIDCNKFIWKDGSEKSKNEVDPYKMNFMDKKIINNSYIVHISTGTWCDAPKQLASLVKND